MLTRQHHDQVCVHVPEKHCFLSLFIYLILRESERERENPKQALHCQYRARCRARTHES